MWEETEKLKRQIPLLDYLRRHNWSLHPVGSQQEFVGLCPLHAETRPSFYVNAARSTRLNSTATPRHSSTSISVACTIPASSSAWGLAMPPAATCAAISRHLAIPPDYCGTLVSSIAKAGTPSTDV